MRAAFFKGSDMLLTILRFESLSGGVVYFAGGGAVYGATLAQASDIASGLAGQKLTKVKMCPTRYARGLGAWQWVQCGRNAAGRGRNRAERH